MQKRTEHTSILICDGSKSHRSPNRAAEEITTVTTAGKVRRAEFFQSLTGLRFIGLHMGTTILGRVIVHATFRGSAVLSSRSFIYLFGNERTINGRRENAIFLRLVRYHLGHAFKFNVRDQNDFVRGRGQTVARRNSDSDGALALATERRRTIFAGRYVRAIVRLVSRIRNMNRAHHFFGLLATMLFDPYMDGIIDGHVIGRVSVLQRRDGLIAWQHRNVLTRVIAVRRSFTFVGVMGAHSRTNSN